MMTTLNDIKHVYFIGIGGIGMSAIARYFNAMGIKVSGYDKTKTILTDTLHHEGMDIHYNDEVNAIPKDIDLIIYTPAIPKDHRGYNFLLNSGIPMMKRAEVLGLISNDKRSIGVAGTHGKTTTSSLITHVLKTGDIDVSAFLGGITLDYNSNFVIGKSDVVVLEADEYDKSFLKLNPFIATISSIDPDHLDIYGDASSMISDGYKAFVSRIRDNGFLIIREGILDVFSVAELLALYQRGIAVYEYGENKGQIQISNIHVESGKYIFDYQGLNKSMKSIILNMPGKHNVENASVAVTAGLLLGVNEADIRKALSGFKGIHRRFERIVETDEIVYIDDYAHHPGELSVAIDAARTLFPNSKLTAIFQPHLYSRTKDFVDGFAKELDKLDEIILLDIYPARELPIEGVTSEIIFDRLKNSNKKMATKENLMSVLKDFDSGVLLTLGAGDIDTFVPKMKEMILMKSKNNK